MSTQNIEYPINISKEEDKYYFNLYCKYKRKYLKAKKLKLKYSLTPNVRLDESRHKNIIEFNKKIVNNIVKGMNSWLNKKGESDD